MNLSSKKIMGDRLKKTVNTLQEIWVASHQKKLASVLFFALCLNLIIAPAVFSATGGTLLRPQAYALGILGLGTLALSIYLFFVMFQPERF